MIKIGDPRPGFGCGCRMILELGKKYFEKGLTDRYTYAIMTMQGGGKPPRKEVEPMSVQEAIALLMLVIAAISLGLSIKR